MSAFFIFEIKRAKMDKIFNFLKERSSVMSGPMDIIFDVFFRDWCEASKNIISQFSQNIAKFITY